MKGTSYMTSLRSMLPSIPWHGSLHTGFASTSILLLHSAQFVQYRFSTICFTAS